MKRTVLVEIVGYFGDMTDQEIADAVLQFATGIVSNEGDVGLTIADIEVVVKD